MARTSRDQYLMDLALRAAQQTTCIRKGVGCVLADAVGRILAVSFNGVAAGQPHCNDHERRPVYENDGRVEFMASNGRTKASFMFAGKLTAVDQGLDRAAGLQVVGYEKFHPHICEGAHLPPGQDNCEAIHAEQNALLQCSNPDLVATAYVTLAPCKSCMKLLLNTGCQRIVYINEHPGSDLVKAMWEKTGRKWEKQQ